MKKDKKPIGRPRKNPDAIMKSSLLIKFDDKFYETFRTWCDDNCIMSSAFVRKLLETELKKRGVI